MKDIKIMVINIWSKRIKKFNNINNYLRLILISMSLIFFACANGEYEGSYDYTIILNEESSTGVLKLESGFVGYSGTLKSFQWGTVELENLDVADNALSAQFERWDNEWSLKGIFSGDKFKGSVTFEDDKFVFSAKRQSNDPVTIDRSKITYLLPQESLPEIEKDIDHAGMIEELDRESYRRGAKIYNSNCINCHGLPDMEGSLPLSLKFWEQPFKGGGDPYSMYQTVSRGFGTMPPQVMLSPKEKYDVISYIREKFVKSGNEDQYFKVSPGYLSQLPEGSSRGPDPKPYTPWADMDYGNFFMNTFELVDAETGPERFHSPEPVPFADEDYRSNNFAYKGIAIRLDKGPGGVLNKQGHS
jgi:cytochrome c5